MRSPHEITGYPAADGSFCGPLYWLDERISHQIAQGSPDGELNAFRRAVSAAKEDLRALSLRSPAPAAEMLEVQLLWLEDMELLQPVERRIMAGEVASNAWRAEIAGHAGAIDPEALGDIRDIEERVLKLLLNAERLRLPKGSVLAGQDISPSQFLEADWSEGGAIILEQGSTSSHAAILARGRGVPMIVGVGSLGRDHKFASVDGSSGRCILDPDPAQPPHETILALKTVTSRQLLAIDGPKIELFINVNSLDELAETEPEYCDGIGLVRSEFLFRDVGAVPDEVAQVDAYSAIVKWARGRAVNIRLFDLGGDKPTFGLDIPPGVGSIECRGVSVLLNNREVLLTQLRALLRASELGDVRILLPMVSKPEQLSVVRQMLRDCAPVTASLPPLGVMVEVPDVAKSPQRFADAEFFSLGTNDLAQFITGRSRHAPGGSQLSFAERSELFNLISTVIIYGKVTGKAVCLCGDLASDLNSLDNLLKLGLRAFSLPPLKAPEFASLRQAR
jgi:phosphoenolpyruvate-protein phosphotransferase (PTS system enzyme I)